MALVINTPSGKKSREDDLKIRTAAILIGSVGLELTLTPASPAHTRTHKSNHNQNVVYDNQISSNTALRLRSCTTCNNRGKLPMGGASFHRIPF